MCSAVETQESVETRLLDVVQKVIDMGADVNATNRAGDMPLHLAAYVSGDEGLSDTLVVASYISFHLTDKGPTSGWLSCCWKIKPISWRTISMPRFFPRICVRLGASDL